MEYLIYQTTNLINGKIYIGKHKTKNINDSYLGSGKLLKCAIDKYGKENFKKEILYILDTEKEMDELEKEIIDDEFIKRDDVYNIMIGGEGGWGNIHEKLRNDEEYKNKFMGRLNDYYESHDSPWLGRKHKKETIEKMKNVRLEKDLTGEKSHMHGRITINFDNVLLKFIKKEELEYYLSLGWEVGSIFKEKSHPLYNKITITLNDSDKKIIKKDELDYWLSLGWVKGVLSPQKEKMKKARDGRIWVVNIKSNKTTMIKKERVSDYISNGWTIGRKVKDSRT